MQGRQKDWLRLPLERKHLLDVSFSVQIRAVDHVPTIQVKDKAGNKVLVIVRNELALTGDNRMDILLLQECQIASSLPPSQEDVRELRPCKARRFEV